MDIVVQPVNGVAVATILVEDLDASNASDFKRDIAPTLDAYPQLVLDLSRLRFVDSSGLGALISCLRKLNAAGGDLKLCRLSPPVRAVFELGAAPPPVLDGSRESGFGIYLMTNSVSEVQYSRDDRGKHCIALVQNRGA